MDLKNIRQEYKKHELKLEDLDSNPIMQFKKWFQDAEEHQNLEPNAMTLATVNKEYIVTNRIVLLKEVIDNKFRFFTNYSSTKGKNIAANKHVSTSFFWQKSERQVIIKGTAEKCTQEVSENYFYSRPIGSQAGAIASNQSEIIEDKDALIYKFEETKELKNIKKPENWGGYDIVPLQIEFWQGGKNRLHDRFIYKLEEGQWKINRVSP